MPISTTTMASSAIVRVVFIALVLDLLGEFPCKKAGSTIAFV